MLLFGPEKPDFANTWRAIVAIFLLFVGGVAVFVFAAFQAPLFDMSVVLQTFKQSMSALPAVGGDVNINPPLLFRPRRIRPLADRSVGARSEVQVQPPKLPQLIGQPFDINKLTAQSILVKDNETGAVLLAKDEYTPRPMASITKLMSALVILEKKPDWSSTATVIPDELVDTHMYAGDTHTLEELWYAALVGSSNKAIYTLADAIGWPRAGFVDRMNEKARELGLSDAVFADPTGLLEGNVGTASDLAIILREALKHEKIKEAMLTKEHNLYSKERNKKHHIWNTNWLLLGWIPNKFAEIRGGKTGYIPSSGYNFVTEVVDDKGHVLDVVILGAAAHEARFTEARDAAVWAFASYEWPK